MLLLIEAAQNHYLYGKYLIHYIKSKESGLSLLHTLCIYLLLREMKIYIKERFSITQHAETLLALITNLEN
jgi:hypothetical protein